MTKASDNPYPSLLFEEHVDPANPAAGHQRIFVDTDHALKIINSAGAVTAYGSGSVATDTIWDAAGDLAIGTGANTAAALTKGAAGTVPTAGASTLAYAFPPGHEYDYAVNTASDPSVTATSAATANTLATGNAVAYDGSTVVLMDIYCPAALSPSGQSCRIVLYDGSSLLYDTVGWLGSSSGTANVSFHGFARFTPTNATHTYSIRAYVSSGTATFYRAGADASACSFRITKA